MPVSQRSGALTVTRRAPSTPRLLAAFVLIAACLAAFAAPALAELPTAGPFRRIASFPVFQNTDIETETVAEIVTATDDGNLLIYTDGETENIGFVDISNPAAPVANGIVAVGGEPTSVVAVGAYALAGVNTSESFVAPSGTLQVIDIARRTIVRTIDVGGQPDSVAVSPDARFAAVVIENERDEDLGDGAPPQAPAGGLVIVDLIGMPADWTVRPVDLTGIADRFPTDPEPEFVAINEANQAVVTLQENNYLAIIDLASGTVVNHFSAGTVDLTQIDDNQNDLIELSASLSAVPREPDAVTWISVNAFATADEGDLEGGSRGFTIFDRDGNVLYASGNSLEHLVARMGHYPEDRSENKGNEPESVTVGRYDHGAAPYLFVGSERSNVVVIYDLRGVSQNGAPALVQVLPTSTAPEGLLAIPERDLFVIASEEDARDDRVRSTISIYQRFRDGSDYPKIVSTNRMDGTPIPWAALSGLALDPIDPSVAYSVYDSFYRQSRIFTLDISGSPAVITAELAINDANGVLAGALQQLAESLPNADDFDPATLINDDGTINVDPEGVAARAGGGFYVVSEGSGNLEGGVSDPESRPFASPNLLLTVAANGTIERATLLPLPLTSNQLRFGFEGVTADADGNVYVAFQREWTAAGDPDDRVRIGRYDGTTGDWTFAYYPLDEATSPNGGWVGLSDLTYLGADTFAVIERDNQGGPDATVKRINAFSTAGIDFAPHTATPSLPVLSKTLVTDLITDGYLGTTAGPVLEKWEGLLVLPDGSALIVNDNDGVDGSSGETQLLRLARLFDDDAGDPSDVEPFVCVNSDTTTCLNDGRFQVSATWEDFDGDRGDARVADVGTSDSGVLWFFNDDNWEVLLKVLNGCPENDHYWVFTSATTNVAYILRVVDTHTGKVVTYDNPLGRPAPANTDTRAFATCP